MGILLSTNVDGCYPADAIAVTASVEPRWPAQVIKDLLERRPRLGLNLIRDLEGRPRKMESRLRDPSNGPVEQRIAPASVRLVNKFGKCVPDGAEISFPLSRQDLADLAGTTLHPVGRTLGAWQVASQIKRGRRRVIVTEMGRLMQLATAEGSLEPQSRRTHRRFGGRPS